MYEVLKLCLGLHHLVTLSNLRGISVECTYTYTSDRSGYWSEEGPLLRACFIVPYMWLPKWIGSVSQKHAWRLASRELSSLSFTELALNTTVQYNIVGGCISREEVCGETATHPPLSREIPPFHYDQYNKWQSSRRPVYRGGALETRKGHCWREVKSLQHIWRRGRKLVASFLKIRCVVSA